MLLLALNIVVGVFLVNWLNPISVLQFLIMEFVNIGIAHSLAELILSLLLKKKDLPKLEKLSSAPSVALLYTTYNDAIPEVLSSLKEQTYKNCTVFVLDDSTDKHKKKVLDDSGYRVVRREHRHGFKAGALNNWLSLFGDKYDYFVVLDSDSKLPRDFVEEMVKYAEHSENERVAIFQSKTEIWNVDCKFTKTSAMTAPIWMYKMERLANDCDIVLPWGHNNLFRTDVLKELGGFEADFVSEDFATDLKIISKGYKCRLVDIVSYEGTPRTIRSFTKRTIRWSSGALQLLLHGRDYTRNIPFSTGLYLFWTAYFYLIWAAYIPGMFLAIWGHQSSLNDVLMFIGGGHLLSSIGLVQLALISFYIAYFLFLNLPIALRLGIVKDFVKNIPLNAATSFYMMVPLVRAELKTAFEKKAAFEVTEKGYLEISLFELLRDMKLNLLFASLLVIGTVRNPLALLFNWFWFLLYLASPWVIYATHTRKEEKEEFAGKNG